MEDKLIEIEADTLEDVRKQIKDQMPVGFNLLSEKVRRMRANATLSPRPSPFL
jgi:hypothetical protein